MMFASVTLLPAMLGVLGANRQLAGLGAGASRT